MPSEETGFAPEPGPGLFPELPLPEAPRVIWRVGRHVGRTIYLQAGPEPSDEDVLIGMLDTPELAAEAVAARNAAAAKPVLPEPGPDGFTEYTCGACGGEFRSNCSPGDITCVDCDARLCSHCGEWDAAVDF